MFSLDFQNLLEAEVVGQSRAVRTIVRAITLSMSGLAVPDGPIGTYLLIGPTGTGKTHLARSITRRLHGDERALAIVDCGLLDEADPWSGFHRQISSLVVEASYAGETGDASGEPRLGGSERLPILVVDHLERAPAAFAQGLMAAIENGGIPLPDGRSASLAGCLVLLTSNICAVEIFEADRAEIGFSAVTEQFDLEEKARIYALCVAAAVRCWGRDFLSHLDDLVVFHRLCEDHLPLILARHVDELNRRLATHGMKCQLDDAAAGLLVERSSHFLEQGAWVLSKVFRRFVEFPLADLILSGLARRGGMVNVELEGHRLRLTLSPAGEPAALVRDLGAPPIVRVPGVPGEPEAAVLVRVPDSD